MNRSRTPSPVPSSSAELEQHETARTIKPPGLLPVQYRPTPTGPVQFRSSGPNGHVAPVNYRPAGYGPPGTPSPLNALAPDEIDIANLQYSPSPHHPLKNRLLLFCDIVLKHEGIIGDDDDDNRATSTSSGENKQDARVLVKNERTTSSPLNSVGESAVDSIQSGSSVTGSEINEEEEYDEEAYESISCWCGQPFHGRPMIECDNCSVWYHMACENVVEGKVPDRFFCKRCRSRRRKRSSTSSRRGGKRKRTSSGATATKQQPESVPPPTSLNTDYSPISSPSSQPEQEFVASPLSGISEKLILPNNFPSKSSQGVAKGKRKKKVYDKKEKVKVDNAPHSFNSSSSLGNAPSQIGLNSYDNGTMSIPSTSNQNDLQNLVPSTSGSHQPPPLLPCYAPAVDTSFSTPQTHSLVERGLYSTSELSTGIANSCPTSSSQPSNSHIPKLEPQVPSNNLPLHANDLPSDAGFSVSISSPYGVTIKRSNSTDEPNN